MLAASTVPRPQTPVANFFSHVVDHLNKPDSICERIGLNIIRRVEGSINHGNPPWIHSHCPHRRIQAALVAARSFIANSIRCRLIHHHPASPSSVAWKHLDWSPVHLNRRIIACSCDKGAWPQDLLKSKLDQRRSHAFKHRIVDHGP